MKVPVKVTAELFVDIADEVDTRRKKISEDGIPDDIDERLKSAVASLREAAFLLCPEVL